MADDSHHTMEDDASADDGLADDDVDGMLANMMATKPHLAKWMVSSPELMKKKQKEKERKDKRKRKHQAEDDDDDDKPRPKKKAKSKVSDTNEESVEITGYIHVMKPPPPTAPRSRSKPKPESLYIQRGPFKFLSTCSYESFLTTLSNALPCPVVNLVQDKIQWKPQTPANRSTLPLGGEVGFSVMLDQISRSKDHIVILSMPGPKKPAEDAPFWATDDDVPDAGTSTGPSTSGSHPEKDFDFAELEANNAEESVEQQKMSFDKAVAPKIEELKERWPLNDQQKRIYTDDKGFQWELTPIHLNVWGAHLARGTATIDKAPLSAQFDIKNRIKSTSNRTVSATIPTPMTPSLAHVPNTPAQPSTSERLLEMLALTMLQQQSQQHPQVPIPNLLPLAHPSIPSAPPSPEKLRYRDVSLEEFCAYYKITPHLEKLQKLEYKPGDEGIKRLQRDEWGGRVGFAELTWEKILDKHRRFMADARAGLWA